MGNPHILPSKPWPCLKDHPPGEQRAWKCKGEIIRCFSHKGRVPRLLPAGGTAERPLPSYFLLGIPNDFRGRFNSIKPESATSTCPLPQMSRDSRSNPVNLSTNSYHMIKECHSRNSGRDWVWAHSFLYVLPGRILDALVWTRVWTRNRPTCSAKVQLALLELLWTSQSRPWCNKAFLHTIETRVGLAPKG